MLGMIIAHAAAIILGVYANKFIGGSLVGMLNILFSAEMVYTLRLNYLQELILMIKTGMDFSIQDLQWFH